MTQLNPLVSTEKGPIPFLELEVRDVVFLEEHARLIATEYVHSGEIVRRDVWASMLHGVTSEIIGKL